MKRVLFLICSLFVLLGCSHKERKNFSVIFISLDTSRYDYIDTGQGAEAETPELKRFAADSIVFENAFATAPLTLPSHLSVFTSRFPHELGVFGNEYKYEGNHKMIQQVLKDAGFYTAAVISLGTLGEATGVKKGFTEFRDDLFGEEVFFVPAEKITSKAIDILHELRNRQFFLFTHFSDPHTPYAPPDIEGRFEIHVDGKLARFFNSYTGAILRETLLLSKGNHEVKFKVLNGFDDFSCFILRRLGLSEGCTFSASHLEFSESLYGGCFVLRSSEGRLDIHCEEDGQMEIFQVIPILKERAVLKYYRKEVEYMDGQVGRLLKEIEKRRLLDKTIIVVFGDHGEGLGERENFFGHSRFLNRQYIHVPLIMRLPGTKGIRIHSPVSLADLSPTVLEFLEIKNKSFDRNRSLLKGISEDRLEERLICSFAFESSSRKNMLSLIKWPYQRVYYFNRDKLEKSESYDLSLFSSYSEEEKIDDAFIRNSKEDHKVFEERFDEFRRIFSLVSEAKGNIDKKSLEKIKALGYVNN